MDKYIKIMPPKAAKGKKKETTKEESSSVPSEKNEPTEREIQLRSQFVINFLFRKFSFESDPVFKIKSLC